MCQLLVVTGNTWAACLINRRRHWDLWR